MDCSRCIVGAAHCRHIIDIRITFYCFRNQLTILKALKFYLSIKVYMRKLVIDKDDIFFFRTGATNFTEYDNIRSLTASHLDELITKMDEFTRNGW